MVEREIIDTCKKYIQSIAQAYPLTKAYMFGSFAKGTNRTDSDIDLAIVLKGTGDTVDIQWQLMKLRRDFDLRIEPHPINETDFNFNHPLVSEILKTGIEIEA
jgi:predicted nucleotidyltransferase